MINDQQPETKSSLSFFTRKVWIVTGILALSIILIFLLKAAFDVLLMILAATLIAVYFHGLADVIERLTKFKRGWSMAISVTLTLVLSVATFWFMGNKLQIQISELQQDFPDMIEKARQSLGNTMLGEKVLESLSGFDTDKMMSAATGVFNTGFGVIANLYIVIFLGIFFTISPDVYKNGIIKLTPVEGKQQAEVLLQRIANVLKGWLKGMLLAMLMITIT
ncbi:MAG: AI-2E family transporter, partial [Chryseobacterium sp.]